MSVQWTALGRRGSCYPAKLVARQQTSLRCRPVKVRWQSERQSLLSAMLKPDSVKGFGDRSLNNFYLAVIGDLHLAPEQMHLFQKAQQHLTSAMSPDGTMHQGARIVQLGDLGHGKHKSGSRSCFESAHNYLSSFQAPTALILGNHDLEGEEFETDEANLAAWQSVFQQPYCWVEELGPAVLIGLSTTRFRENINSHHEVHIDDRQMEWLNATLHKYTDRPIVIFTHAPPMGCGLKVLQELHIKNRCAWLNHSDRPQRFMELVAQHPNITLWFSGHFHLSHNYPDSISLVGRTAFVQTGVIGRCNRDGFRQSRMLEGDQLGYRVYTVDHDTGERRLDLSGEWLSPRAPVVSTPEEELLCDPEQGWLCSEWNCDIDKASRMASWYPLGGGTMLARQSGWLVEYDFALMCPIGVVCTIMDEDDVQLLDAAGQPSVSEDGSDVASLLVVRHETGVSETFSRNACGGFYRIFQPNKWRLKQEAKMAQVAGAASVQGEETLVQV